MVNAGFVAGQGSFGVKLLESLPPAAMRYTEVRMSTDLSKQMFELLDQAPKAETEAGYVEPINLPVRVPVALIYGATGIGVGCACNIPAFTRESLIKAYEESDPRHLQVNIKNLNVVKADLRSLWDSGRGSITYSYTVTKEWSKLDNQEVVVISGNGSVFTPRHNNVFRDYLRDNLIWMRDESSSAIRLVIGKVKGIKRINIDNIYEKAQVASKATVGYSIKIWDFRDNKVKAIGVGEWMCACYEVYKSSMKSYVADNVASRSNEIALLNKVPDVMKALDNSDKDLMKKFSLSQSDLDKIEDLPIKYRKRETVDKRIQILNSQISEFNKKLVVLFCFVLRF
jgi:hypothetical protein